MKIKIFLSAILFSFSAGSALAGDHSPSKNDEFNDKCIVAKIMRSESLSIVCVSKSSNDDISIRIIPSDSIVTAEQILSLITANENEG
ncbi:MAG: hypothetical protein A2Z20_04680 [Bdellovibrionales bacterium RBG_16_40_8]|nr:MAG: hypothetical protein A2Z20_04680 [Bdellovibrionales bacterium RBG_16_40_8]